MEIMKLRVGQLWVDCESSSPLRLLVVESIEEFNVKCSNILTDEVVVIPKIEMPVKSTGYCLFKDPVLTSVFIEQYDKRRAA